MERVRIFYKRSLKRLKGKYKQVPEDCNTIFYDKRASILLLESEVMDQLRKIEYTMKSLILAQDER